MTLRIEKRGAVGWLVFDQPAKHNAINGAMWRGIAPAMKQFDADPDVRCVAFRGAGTETFSAGADISEFESEKSERRIRRASTMVCSTRCCTRSRTRSSPRWR